MTQPIPWTTRFLGFPPRYLFEGGNPGGWPTGPLESRSFYDRRDACNAGADIWTEIEKALTPVVKRLSDHMVRARR